MRRLTFMKADKPVKALTKNEKKKKKKA